MAEDVYSHYLKAFAMAKANGALTPGAFVHPVSGDQYNVEILAAIALAVQDAKATSGIVPRERGALAQEIARLMM